MRETIIDKFKRVNGGDIAHIFLMLLAWPVALLYRIKRPQLWLLCEYADEARDNAYYLYRYIRKNQPSIDAVYAINKRASDYQRVKDLGQIVQYGSFMHWVMYLAACVNISSQKGGKPNAAVCYLLEVVWGYRNFRVFLQHGVVLNDLPYIYYKQSKISLITCTTSFEYRDFTTVYGYRARDVARTGLCRFDALTGTAAAGYILVVPTWRQNLKRCSRSQFSASAYYRQWQSFLNNPALDALLTAHDKKIKFLVHRNLAQFGDVFSSRSSRVELLQWQDVAIDELIAAADMCLTDYSSISIDVAYLKRPVLYYMFDEAQFRAAHAQTSSFSYRADGLGAVVSDEAGLMAELAQIADADMQMGAEYRARWQNFFGDCGDGHCQRTYQAIWQRLKED